MKLSYETKNYIREEIKKRLMPKYEIEKAEAKLEEKVCIYIHENVEKFIQDKVSEYIKNFLKNKKCRKL